MGEAMDYACEEYDLFIASLTDEEWFSLQRDDEGNYCVQLC